MNEWNWIALAGWAVLVGIIVRQQYALRERDREIYRLKVDRAMLAHLEEPAAGAPNEHVFGNENEGTIEMPVLHFPVRPLTHEEVEERAKNRRNRLVREAALRPYDAYDEAVRLHSHNDISQGRNREA